MERKKLYNSINEAESRKDALRRALAISTWKRAGGKVDKMPPGRASGIYKGKGVKQFDDDEEDAMNRAIMAYRKLKKKKKYGKKEGMEESKLDDNIVDLIKKEMDAMLKAAKKGDYKTLMGLYKALGRIIK
jgi:hypothetical protein